MKHFLLGFALLGSTLFASGQCTPEGDFTGIEFGAIPDTIANFAQATVNALYVQQIDVKIPANGGFLDLPFITVDSAQLVQVFNLPEGLSFVCNSPLVSPCTFLGGSVGCGVISGIPNIGGLYDLEILLAVYTNLGTFPLNFTGYKIQVNWPLSVNDASRRDFGYLNLMPNPANDQTVLSTQVTQAGKGTLRVFDLVGKEVLKRNISLIPGQNNITISTTALPEGIYLCVVEALGQKHTRRLMIVH